MTAAMTACPPDIYTAGTPPNGDQPPHAPLLVLGRTGQLATALRQRAQHAPHTPQIICVGRPDFSLEAPEAFGPLLDRLNPSLVINAAAWTAVDLAESHPEEAVQINHLAPAHLAAEAGQRGVPFLQVSTDYVFDGTLGQPYTEDTPPCPQTVYGRTKEAGERAVLAASPFSSIFRTAWVYGPAGKNFVRTMLQAAQKTPALRVVGDQKGCPTNAEDLADALLKVAATMCAQPWQPDWHGIFHAVGHGEATWYGLAREALEEAARHGHPLPDLQPITTQEWPTPARRPADSRLATEKLSRTFDITLPDWRASTRRTVRQILNQQSAAPVGQS